MVLKFGGDDVPLSLPGPHGRPGAQGLHIGLTAAGGEGDLPGLSVQVAGEDLPRGGELFRCPLSRCMQTGGIGKNLLETGHHGR